MWDLAEALRVLGRCDEAEPLARRTLEIWEGSFGAEHEWTAWGLIGLAEVLLAQGDADEASDGAQRAVRILERLFGKGHAVLGSTLNLQGRALVAAGHHAAAEAVLVSALEIQSSLAAEAKAAEATRVLLASCRATVESSDGSLRAPLS